MNKKATDLYQLLKINDAPLDARCKQLEEMCFPSIFTHGVYGMQFSRKVPLGPSEYVKAMILQSRDYRFRLNQQFIFFHFHQATIHQLSSGIYHKLKILRPKDKLTVGRYLDMVSNDEIEADLTSIYSRLRNSEQYLIKPRNNLHCMTMYYGPATWFLTLSPSEWTWEEMGDYLRKINLSLKEMSISALVASDPVSVCRYMENAHKAFIDFILLPDNPIGKVSHYFCRREYQVLGLQHFHFASWIENAPIIGENSNEKVTQSDKISSQSVEEAVAGRKALKANSRLYDLPRCNKERMTNDYNAATLLVWNGNMDIQYIGEKSTILKWYITKYTTKAEKGHSNAAFTELASTKSLASQLWNIALCGISHREWGALEVCDKTDSSTVFRWVDVNILRSHRVKEYKAIKDLPSDSSDLFYPSWIDTIILVALQHLITSICMIFSLV